MLYYTPLFFCSILPFLLLLSPLPILCPLPLLFFLSSIPILLLSSPFPPFPLVSPLLHGSPNRSRSKVSVPDAEESGSLHTPTSASAWW